MKKTVAMLKRASETKMQFLISERVKQKGAVLILSILALSQVAAFAYIKEGTTTDISNLQGKGFSQSTLRIIDSERARQQRDGEYYVKYYEDDYYAKDGRYRRFKLYLDPLQDDGLFGNREIQFTNQPFSEHPSADDKRYIRGGKYTEGEFLENL